MCCDVGLVSELRPTAGCVLMDLASPAVSGTSVYANGLKAARYPQTTEAAMQHVLKNVVNFHAS